MKRKEYQPVIAESHTPPYEIHRYFARRPWNVFQQLVEKLSRDNDIVLDPFCGGGVTIYEGVKIGRRMIGFDLNPLSIFIVENMIKNDISLENFETSYKKIDLYIQSLYADFNKIKLENNDEINISWNELAFNIYCNFCGQLVSLSNLNKKENGKYYCPNNKCVGSKEKKGHIRPSECERDGYNYLYCVATDKRKQIQINYNDKLLKKINEHIIFLKKIVEKNKIILKKDPIPMNWDRQHEDLLHKKGINTFQDFFTEKNFLINSLVLDFIKKMKLEKKMYELMRLVFSSSLRETNIMAFTNSSWQSGKPTTWAKHAFWIPSQFCEVNIREAFKKAYQRVKKCIIYNKQFDYNYHIADSFSQINNKKANIYLNNSSIEQSDIPNNSVDAIITDPPYGSNVQYLELSHFWHVWNQDIYNIKSPDFSKEAVCNRKKNFEGSKDMQTYEDNLYRVFKKSFEVLKTNGNMALTFNNKDMGAWIALLISIFKAGFTLEKNGLYFQDGVQNYKQTSHTKSEGSPYGDFIYVFKKSKIKTGAKTFKNEDDFINEVDKSFRKHFKNTVNQKNRNGSIKKMFLEVVPIIEMYVKQGQDLDRKKLYSHFNKNYLDLIYSQ